MSFETDRITEWFKQLYRDLDDRHLLIPAIGLLVAIVAVPLLLGGGSSGSATSAPSTAAAVAPAEMAGAEEVDPVVLADVPGLRDYRKRLDRFNARNPFEQQMTGGGGGGNGGNGGGGNGSGTGSSSTGSGTTGTGSGTTDTGGDSGSTTPPSTDTGGDDSDEGETKLIYITLDVKVGRPGEAKVLKDVEPLTYLPGKERPIVQYVQGNLDASKAAFVVSPDVVSSEGDGRCEPGRDDCQFLLMHEGDEQFFEYGDQLKKYKLQILAINRKVVDAKGTDDVAADARETSRATADFVADLDG